ncbi:MAG: hypothetical protein ACR2OO_04710 [Thermomicrobiales bacterium]
MPRLRAFLSCLVLLSAAAAAAGPVRAAATGVFDPAAVLLRPSDLDRPGYEIYANGSDSAESLGRHLNLPDLKVALQGDGFIRSYRLALALPAADNPRQIGTRLVQSRIERYATAAGAAKGFTVEAATWPSSDVIADAAVVGDRSHMDNAQFGNPDTGAPMLGIHLMARVGTFVVAVEVGDGTGVRPTQAEAYTLMAALLAKLAAADGPGLGAGAAYLAGDGIDTPYDGYGRIAGKDLPLLGYSAADFQPQTDFFGDATDVYYLRQEVPAAGAVAGGVVVLFALAFPDAKAASAALLRFPPFYASDPGRSGSDLVATHAVGKIGDESSALTYAHTDGQGAVTHGVAVAFRIGPTAYVVGVRGPVGPTATAVTALAQAVAACAGRRGTGCGPLAMPAGLMGA